jgi:ligand-binding SRPBCC domain-containing protein
MTRDQALALARIVAKVDGLPLLDTLRAEQRSPTQSSKPLWSVFSRSNGQGSSVRFFVNSDGLRALRTSLLEPIEPLTAVREVGSRVAWRFRGWGRIFETVFRVEELRPDERLVETQETGPLRRCRHVLAALDAAGGTLMRERIAYQASWGVLGELADPMLGLRPALEDAFDARAAIALERFGSLSAATSSAR